MDVDGNEIDVLEGGAETFSRHAPLIMMEFSPDVFPEGGRSFKELPDALVALGYRARTVELLRAQPRLRGEKIELLGVLPALPCSPTPYLCMTDNRE